MAGHMALRLPNLQCPHSIDALPTSPSIRLTLNFLSQLSAFLATGLWKGVRIILKSSFSKDNAHNDCNYPLKKPKLKGIWTQNFIRVCIFVPPSHDNVVKWKHYPRYWPFVRGIHLSPVDSPHKGQWRGPLISSLIYVWTNGCANKQWFWCIYSCIYIFFWWHIFVHIQMIFY